MLLGAPGRTTRSKRITRRMNARLQEVAEILKPPDFPAIIDRLNSEPRGMSVGLNWSGKSKSWRTSPLSSEVKHGFCA